MERLNYNHLLYFWVVAREGGLAPAGRVLRLTHPTLSAQIHALEEDLGEKLFVRSGRRLELTDVGRLVYRYADEIFSLGRELVDDVRGRAVGRPNRLVVGIADVVPKFVVRELLAPALVSPAETKLVCHEDSFDRLLADLALHELDLILTDSPVPSGSAVRAYNHLLGETGMSFFGTDELVRKFKGGFPGSLDQAPMLLPLEGTTSRRSMNQWFDRHAIRPRVVAEFEDSALLKAFGADGLGIFPAPTVVEKEVGRQYRVSVLGRAPELRERFYAISSERRLKHPAVVAIFESARRSLFASSSTRSRSRSSGR